MLNEDRCPEELQIVVGQVREQAPYFTVRCSRGRVPLDPHGVHTGETQYGDQRLVVSWSGV